MYMPALVGRALNAVTCCQGERRAFATPASAAAAAMVEKKSILMVQRGGTKDSSNLEEKYTVRGIQNSSCGGLSISYRA